MATIIQRVSPQYVTRALTRHQCGSYVMRHPTNNDELITLISMENDRKECGIDDYVVLSLRVDETIYKTFIQHYRLPYDKQNTENISKMLSIYNQQKSKSENGRFEQLKEQILLPPEDQECTFDGHQLQGIEFGGTANGGKNNMGVSTAYWKCHRQNDVKVFIKRFIKDSSSFQHELDLLKDLCHFSIITVYGQYSDLRFSYIVLQDAGQSLESKCPLHFGSIRLKMRFIANVGFQIAYAMMYLEKKNIVHRDLTAGNILIDAYGFIRVGDFGHAIKQEEGKNTLERSKTISGQDRFQIRFLAPECLPTSTEKEAMRQATAAKKKKDANQSNSIDVYAKFSSKSDVWSFGLVLVQLMLNAPFQPYPDIKRVEDVEKYVKEERKIHPEPKLCNQDLYLLLTRCWTYEAKSRISFSEIRTQMFKLEAIFKEAAIRPSSSTPLIKKTSK